LEVSNKGKKKNKVKKRAGEGGRRVWTKINCPENSQATLARLSVKGTLVAR
jgi:hypothetical protein